MSRLKLGQFLLALTLPLMVGGCFRPLYGDQAVSGHSAVLDGLRSIEVPSVNTSGDQRIPRIGGEVRNELIFAFTGGGQPNTANYTLNVSLSTQNQQIIADVNSARNDGSILGINAGYSLVEVGTGKQVLNSSTFARVSYDLPGQQQRFAGQRSLRDAENRAAKVIAESIRSRLASYFAAGT